MATGDGYSQQDPSDTATGYNRDTFVMRQLISQISTAKIVKVIAVTIEAPGRGTVDVQPMVGQIDGNNNVTPHGTIFGIPYRSFQYGKNAVLADPAVGDEGVMICADRDISAVKASKDISSPGSPRQYDPSDGIYLGGLLGNESPEQFMKFTDTGTEIADKNGNTLVSSPIGWKFTGNVIIENNLQLGGNVLSEAGGLYAGNLHIGGTLTADTEVASGSIGLQAHHHTAQGAFAATTVSQP